MSDNSYERLDAHQIVPLTTAELQEVRAAATRSNITPGILMRRLALLALDGLDAASLAALGAQEAAEVVERRRAAGRAGADRRWGRA